MLQGRQSRFVIAGDTEDKLIDVSELGIEQRQEPLLDSREAFHLETSRVASGGSSGTVVRTPTQRHQTSPSPSACELFENGISFDTLNQLDDESEPRTSGLHSGITAMTGNKPFKEGKRESLFRRQPKPTPSLKIIPPNNLLSSSNSKPNRHIASFLAGKNLTKGNPAEKLKSLQADSTTSSLSLPNFSAQFSASSPNQASSTAADKKSHNTLFFDTPKKTRDIELDSMIPRRKSAIHQSLQTLLGSRARNFQQESQSTPTPQRSSDMFG